MEVLKKHKDTLIIIGSLMTAVAVSIIWLVNTIHGVEERLSQRIDGLDRRLIRIETVLILKGIMPQEMTAKENK